MADRLMVFIDGSNLYHSLRSHFGRSDLDFAKFVSCLKETRELRRTYYYGAQVDQALDPQGYKSQQRFLDSLNRVPYFEVRLGRLVYRNWPTSAPFEKGIDVRLATDMLTHAFRNNFDVALLVSADADFGDMLQAVKDLGKHVEVALFGASTSSRRLRDAADRVIPIDVAFLANCWR